MPPLASQKFPESSGLRGSNQLLHGLALLEDVCLVLLLAALVLFTAGQVLLRNILETALPWGDQLPRLLVLWLGLVGAMSATRHHRHINMDLLSRWLPARTQAFNSALTGFFTAGITAVLAYHAARFVAMDYTAGFRAFGVVPLWLAELILPVGFGVIGLRYFLASLNALWELWRKESRR